MRAFKWFALVWRHALRGASADLPNIVFVLNRNKSQVGPCVWMQESWLRRGRKLWRGKLWMWWLNSLNLS